MSEIDIPARRYREGQWGGGVLVFMMDACFARVTLIEISKEAERLGAIVHSDRVPYMVC